MRCLQRWLSALAFSVIWVVSVSAQRLEFTWPTPNTAWQEGRSIDAYIQPTASSEPTSGCFGCVRSGGAQFHEGIDLKPVKRDRRGEPADSVFAVLPGIVRHINPRAGDSSYGRYIVLEHPDVTPAVYSLYAHLASVETGLKVGDRVERGQTLALMGRSAGGYTIPRERAHLHFEFGVMVTREFQSWYLARKFGSKNEQGLWNGMNLMGFDALAFFDAYRAKRIDTFDQYFAKMESAVRFRISTRRVPDFVQRYPSLVTRRPDELVAGWEITVNSAGLPFRWVALSSTDVLGYRPNEIRIIDSNAAALKAFRCKSLLMTRRGVAEPGKDLQTLIQQLFGLN